MSGDTAKKTTDRNAAGKAKKKRPKRDDDSMPRTSQVLEISDELADTLDAIANAETDDFLKLCKVAGLDPLKDLAGSDMRGTDLCGHDLSTADFTHADLREAKFIGTKLINAKLVNAELQNADFRDADLTGADFTGADITGADFSSAKVTHEQLSKATGTPAARPPVNAERMQKLRRHNKCSGPRP